MANGKSGSLEWELVRSGGSTGGYLRVNWTETYDPSKNQSTLNVTGMYFAQTKKYDNHGDWVSYYPDIQLKIEGQTMITMRASSGNYAVNVHNINTSVKDWNDIHTTNYQGATSGQPAACSKTITHSSDGTKTATISIIGYANDRAHINIWWVKSGDSDKTITLTDIPTYTLSTSAGAGSSITVNRISSGYASTGVLSSGARVYTDDALKISFTPSANYGIQTHTVNGATFTSGNTHTVSGNVSVVSTAIPLKSSIGATAASIGRISTITVTRYNDSYTHTITYQLGEATGTIVTKSTQLSIAWTIPDEFYEQIPNSKTGTCTLTIETFNGDTSLGTNSTMFTIVANQDVCSPTVSGAVVDTNTTTVALTGDSSILVRYKSTARCTLTATPKNFATISTTKICETDITGTVDDGIVTATSIYTGVDKTSFKFEAIDSRGYSGSQTISPTVVAYVLLTVNPILTRPTPTGNDVLLSLSGNYYRGSFGSYSNTLTIRYRYKEKAAVSYGDWIVIHSPDSPSANIVYGSGTYRTSSDISLGNNFDYQKTYDFQVQAFDGASGNALTVVTKDDTVKRGLPIFDWGENDFNFHVPIKIGDTELTEQQLQSLLALLT